MSPTAITCHGCGRSGGTLLRCDRCRNVWFCNRECQVVARQQGHTGANCLPVDENHVHRADDAEVAPRVPVAGTTAPGANSLCMALVADACHGCGQSGGKLLRCGRCRKVWFCNRECQVVARQQGHTGLYCRPADGAQRPPASENARSPFAAPTPLMNQVQLAKRFGELFYEADDARLSNNRIGFLAAAEKARQAIVLAEFIVGSEGAVRRSEAGVLQANCLLNSGNPAAAARVACAVLRAAREAGRRTCIVKGLDVCGAVAQIAPDQMVAAERESREYERLSGFPSFGNLDPQEGRISLPTIPAARSRLSLAYREAAVALCDTALKAAGGRGRVAPEDHQHVPTLRVEAKARGSLGVCLHRVGGAPQRIAELIRQAVALLRQAVQETTFGPHLRNAKGSLATWLCTLGEMLLTHGPDGMAEADVCLREALKLGEETDDVHLKQSALRSLINMCGQPGQFVWPAEAAVLRSKLETQDAHTGRSTETSCTICLELFALPGGVIEQDAAVDGNGCTSSAVRVLRCGHQFHLGCLSTWFNTASDTVCPVCKT